MHAVHVTKEESKMRAEILVGLMEDGGVPLEHADAAEEPLRRIIEASEWLLKGGNRRGQ